MIFITFSLLTIIMLVGAESIGIVVELGFNALQHILVLFSTVSSLFFCECLNISLSHQLEETSLFQMSFSYDKIIPVSAPLELLLEAASSCFANVDILIQQVFIQK